MKATHFFTATLLALGMAGGALADPTHVNGGLPMEPNDFGYAWNSTSVAANSGSFSELFDFTLNGGVEWNVSLSEPTVLGNFGPFTAKLDGGPSFYWTATGINMPSGYHTFEVFGSANGSTADWANYSLKFSVASPVLPTPVPEPETYAMLLAGLGVISALHRRRNKKSAIA